MKSNLLALGLAAASLGGCTYHVHIHNHMPQPYAAPGYAHPGWNARPALQPAPVPPDPAVQPLAPSPYAAKPKPRVDSLVGLLDGAFTSGRLEPGWRGGSVEGGIAAIVTQGQAWSGASEGVVFPSPPHAALVRSSGTAPVASVGVLISKPFIVAARTLVWKQRSEAPDVRIVVEVEDAAGGGVIVSKEVAPSVGAFVAQTLDVSTACGRPVRLRLRQGTTKAGFGYFTVFDDVGIEGESCAGASPYHPPHL